jgi:hypothetical protein
VGTEPGNVWKESPVEQFKIIFQNITGGTEVNDDNSELPVSDLQLQLGASRMPQECHFSTVMFVVVETTDSMQPRSILKCLFPQMLVAEIKVTQSVYQRGHPHSGTGCERNFIRNQVLSGLLQDAPARKEVITHGGCVR